jgi:hypothetical protein
VLLAFYRTMQLELAAPKVLAAEGVEAERLHSLDEHSLCVSAHRLGWLWIRLLPQGALPSDNKGDNRRTSGDDGVSADP